MSINKDWMQVNPRLKLFFVATLILALMGVGLEANAARYHRAPPSKVVTLLSPHANQLGVRGPCLEAVLSEVESDIDHLIFASGAEKPTVRCCELWRQADGAAHITTSFITRHLTGRNIDREWFLLWAIDSSRLSTPPPLV